MKKTFKAVALLTVFCFLLSITGCGGLFTSTMMKDSVRDTKKAAEELAAKKSPTELAASAAEVEDKSEAETVVNALSVKAATPAGKAEILALPEDDKMAIIGAATTAVVDMTAIGSSLTDVMEKAQSSSGAGGSSTEEQSKEMVKELVGTIIDSFGDTNTTCVAVILEDSYTVGADGSITLDPTLSDGMKTSIALGAVTVAAASVKASGIDVTDETTLNKIMNAFNGKDADGNAIAAGGATTQAEAIDNVVASVLTAADPGIDASVTANLATSFKTLYALNQSGVDFSQLFTGASK